MLAQLLVAVVYAAALILLAMGILDEGDKCGARWSGSADGTSAGSDSATTASTPAAAAPSGEDAGTDGAVDTP